MVGVPGVPDGAQESLDSRAAVAGFDNRAGGPGTRRSGMDHVASFLNGGNPARVHHESSGRDRPHQSVYCRDPRSPRAAGVADAVLVVVHTDPSRWRNEAPALSSPPKATDPSSRPGQRQPQPQRSQDGTGHRVEHVRAGQQFDADDRSADDTGQRP